MTLFSSVDTVGEGSLIDRWLAEQADLSAVDRFAQRHAAEVGHRQERWYRDLLPATAPAPGQQYAFDVDLDACTGCKACVAACHSLNGLDEEEAWRTVTLLTGLRDGSPFQQTVTAACHHCVDPACLKGCPVDAYEKDALTGIVSHLDDQCIGCSYCTLTCPYEVPTYNHRLGIVRKCDLCRDRLAVGEAPACVQSCPNEAISIALVDVSGVVAATRDGSLVPGAPPSSITAPTTVYRSSRGTQQATASHRSDDGPAHAHVPLAVMLVLTQLSVGAFVTDLVLRWTGDHGDRTAVVLDATVAGAAGIVALAASTFHLGRPLHAYRAVIGLRHSWLSREVVAFGAFTGLAVLDAAVLASGRPPGEGLRTGLAVAVAATGLVGVGCSVLIYTTTRRSSWRPGPVLARFVASGAVTGLAAVAWVVAVSGGAVLGRVLVALAAVTAVKLVLEAGDVLRPRRSEDADGCRRARLIARDLRPLAVRRLAFGGAGLAIAVGVTAGGVRAGTWPAALLVGAALVALVAAEIGERILFFATASRPR
jgi:formate dehydrogenase iron-sulfur subunit